MKDSEEESNLKTGTIYVLRSDSKHPDIAAHREEFHKIGRTAGNTKVRLASAKNDPTYLFAPVECVREYDVMAKNPVRMEELLHTFFKTARIDVTIPAQGSYPAKKAREWFLVPINIIDEAVSLINNGMLSHYWYDRSVKKIVKRSHYKEDII